MTVTYLEYVPTARCGNLFLLLKIWRGSIFKGVWKNLTIFCTFYAIISLCYRWLICQDEEMQGRFEKFCIFCDKYEHLFPLQFILGFYVTQVIARWWLQFDAIVWPDKLAMDLAAFLPDSGKPRQIRRQIVRLANLSVVLLLRRLSSGVAKRFPTYQHLVQAGLLTEKELVRLESLQEVTENKHYIVFAPILWAQATLRKARSDGLFPSDFLYKAIHDDLRDINLQHASLICYAWINIPLVYTQVVTIAVYAYFASALFGRQYLQPSHYVVSGDGTYQRVERFTAQAVNLVGHDDATPDLYVPVFTILEFIFYFGWLHVAEVLINPFGEDDEDFDLNYIIDRNVQISYIEVEGGDAGEELEDPYEGALPTSLPHTVESFKIRELPPAFPTDAVREHMTKEDMALHNGEGDEDATMVILDEAWKEGTDINQSLREG